MTRLTNQVTTIYYTLAIGRIVMGGGSGGMRDVVRILAIDTMDMNVHEASTEHWTFCVWESGPSPLRYVVFRRLSTQSRCAEGRLNI
jgi:hypothetical protein